MNSNALRIAKDRENATKRSSHLSQRSKVTLESAHALVHPLAGHIVETSDLQYALNVLEQITNLSETAGKKLSKYISNDILPFVSDVSESARQISKIENTEIKNILESKMEDVKIASRIINNRAQLSKRFNIQNMVQESSAYPDKTDSIINLCEMIDTYDMKPHIKLNIALENITYEYYKNNVPANNIPDTVLEYFLTRDNNISDKVYKNYKMVLEHNMIYEADDYSDLYNSVMANDGNEYKRQVRALLSDVIQNDNRLEGIDNCSTEADIIATLEELKDFIRTNYPTSKERTCIYQAILLFPLAFGVSKEFIDIEISKRFDLIDMADCLENPDDEIAKEECTSFGEMIQNYTPEELYNALDIYVESTNSNIKDVITDFKADQNKSMGKLKSIIYKWYAKKPEDIIESIPNFGGAIRGIIIASSATVGPVGPLVASIIGLVDHAISRKINDKQCDKLLEKLRNEREAVRKKIRNSTEGKTKNDLSEYEKSLTDAIEKVKAYADSLSNDNHDDDRDFDSNDNDDFGGFGFDFGEFESAAVHMSGLLNICESLQTMILDKSNINNYNLDSIIENFARSNLLSQFAIIGKDSIYRDILENTIYNISKKVIDSPTAVTEITCAKQILKNCNANNYILMYESSKNVLNILTEASIVTEKVNITTLKLLLQNAKAKMKDLSTKEKSISQSIDAHASGFVNSLEKAMTSDRREAIIKGSIIPSFSKCLKGAILLSGVGVFFGPMPAIITALGGFACSTALNAKEKKLIYDEIETELKVVEKQIEIAQNDGDMNQYRFLLNYQKKLTREHQRIKYGLKVSGRDIPSATRPD